MATFEITIDNEKIQNLLQSDQGMAALLEPILNQLLRAEMTEHLRAEPGERTAERRGWRNGSYERRLTTRVGTIELEVPRGRAIPSSRTEGGTVAFRLLASHPPTSQAKRMNVTDRRLLPCAELMEEP